MTLASIPEILNRYRQGKMVIITDDEERENEGDLLIAAEKVTPEDINFMARHARGLICLTLTMERCKQLGLELMVGKNASRFSTNFTVSIEAAEGVTTGISAADRTRTVHAAVNADASPDDIISPGHVFPLMAQPGGVLARAGHTEAGVDLARLAGFEPASVICEVLREDGSMARMDDLREFAERHKLVISSVAELIRYRLEQEPTVERVAESTISILGEDLKVIAYQDIVEQGTHLAFVKGEIDAHAPTLVRVHVESGVFDIFKSLHGGESWTVDDALKRVCKEESGIVVIVRYPEDNEDIIKRMQYSNLEGQEVELPWRQSGQDIRMLGIGGQILADLGAGKLKVMGNPRKAYAVSGFGLQIVDYVTE